MITTSPTKHPLSPQALLFASFLLLAPALHTSQVVAQESGREGQTTEDRIITLIKTAGLGDHARFSVLCHEDEVRRRGSIRELIGVLDDPKAGDAARAFAAYYLGRLHAAEAAESLASHITLSLESKDPGHHQWAEMDYWAIPAMSALCSIGNPAIPALVKNLAMSDDAAVRERSLKALSLIEGDKEIVQLRLEKALKGETDARKRERLQAALTILAGPAYR
jgi:hypothetical protein